MSIADSQQPDIVSDYREYLPPVALREHVLCLWTQSIRASRTAYAHRVLPDACVDLVFFQGQLPAVVGPWTEAFLTNLAPGTRITGVRFQPGKAAAALGLPVCELLNRQADVRDLWNAGARAPFAQVGELTTFRGARIALEAALLRHLRDVASPDSGVVAAIDWIARHPSARVEKLSEFAGVSARQMHRRFSATVGYGPKTFQSILRFQRLLYIASTTASECGLADLATLAGYSDQSHMTREVQRFAGRSTGQLLPSAGCTLKLADLVTANGIDCVDSTV
jgi:AraC-like DNA-binding protein